MKKKIKPMSTFISDLERVKEDTIKLCAEKRDPVTRKYYLQIAGKLIKEIIAMIERDPDVDMSPKHLENLIPPSKG